MRVTVLEQIIVMRVVQYVMVTVHQSVVYVVKDTLRQRQVTV